MSQKSESVNNGGVVQISGDNHGNIYINSNTQSQPTNRLTQEQFNALNRLVEAVEAAREVAGTPLSTKQIWAYLYKAMGVKAYDELTHEQYPNASKYLLVSLQKCLIK